MNARIHLFQAKRKEELSRISSPHLAKLELLLTFSWPETPASTTSNNLEAKIAASVLEQHRGWLVEKAEADLLTRSKEALKGGGSVRESVHLDYHLYCYYYPILYHIISWEGALRLFLNDLISQCVCAPRWQPRRWTCDRSRPERGYEQRLNQVATGQPLISGLLNVDISIIVYYL